MKICVLVLISFIANITIFAQDIIDVTERTIKIGAGKEENIYLGFAEGDKIIFNFKEVDGKELKELEIIEYPNNPKFSEYKISKIENKVINIPRTKVYVLRLKNSANSGRICKFKIQRIPLNNDSKNKNLEIKWIVKKDTTWNSYESEGIIGSDTTYTKKTKKELVKIDTIFTVLSDETIRVPPKISFNNTKKNRITIVNLPTDVYEPNIFKVYKSTHVVGWSYWLGVGKKSIEEYDRANKNVSKGIMAIGNLTGYGALASLIVTGISVFQNPSTGDNVQYRFYGKDGKVFENSNVTIASGRNNNIKQGSFSVEFSNDNGTNSIDVNFKVVVMQVKKVYEDKVYVESKVSYKKGKKQIKEPKVTVVNIPVIDE
jgi:hypothetical protein